MAAGTFAAVGNAALQDSMQQSGMWPPSWLPPDGLWPVLPSAQMTLPNMSRWTGCAGDGEGRLQNEHQRHDESRSALNANSAYAVPHGLPR